MLLKSHTSLPDPASCFPGEPQLLPGLHGAPCGGGEWAGAGDATRQQFIVHMDPDVSDVGFRSGIIPKVRLCRLIVEMTHQEEGEVRLQPVGVVGGAYLDVLPRAPKLRQGERSTRCQPPAALHAPCNFPRLLDTIVFSWNKQFPLNQFPFNHVHHTCAGKKMTASNPCKPFVMMTCLGEHMCCSASWSSEARVSMCLSQPFQSCV